MADASILHIEETHIEAVQRILPSLFESTRQLSGKIGLDKNVEQVNRKFYRIPLETRPGGVYGKVVADGGSLGHGTAFKVNKLTSAYFYAKQAHKLTQEMLDTTSNTTMATVNAFQREMASGIETMQVMADIELHGDGTGVLTEESDTQPSTSSLTFAGAADQIKTGRLREGMAVDVWNAGLTTKRVPSGSTPLIVETINYETHLVTLDQAVTAIAATDRLSFKDIEVYGPSTPTSWSSTWPQGGVAAGLGGDSWRHGVEYYNDNTPANYILGLQKSAVPQLLPAYISGSSGALTFSHGLQLVDKLRQRRDENQISGLIGMFHQKQREQVFNIGIAIANKRVDGAKFGDSVNVMPSNQKYGDQFDYCDIPCFVSKRQRRDRVDFINPQKWGRSEARPLDFFTNREGKRIFEGRSSGGEVSLFVEWFYLSAYDYCCHDPGCQGYIDTLSVPA